LRHVFCEAQAWVKDDFVPRNARRDSRIDSQLQFGRHFGG
jgi:hypothetical protein